MRRTWLSIFVVFLFISPTFGQRDAPVYESYLPQFSIYHDTSEGHHAITIDLLFKKNGGPVEHTEHQAYILVYLKKDEEQILKLAGNSELVKKENEKTAKTFLQILVDKKTRGSSGITSRQDQWQPYSAICRCQGIPKTQRR